jgi:hypothetical protein
MEERMDILLRRGATGKTEQSLRATDMTSSFYNRYFGKSTGIKGPSERSGPAQIPIQCYTYIDNTESENDFFSTQSFPVTLSAKLICPKPSTGIGFTTGFAYF